MSESANLGSELQDSEPRELQHVYKLAKQYKLYNPRDRTHHIHTVYCTIGLTAIVFIGCYDVLYKIATAAVH